MGKAQGGPSALLALHYLTLHLAKQAVEQRLGNGVGGALVGKARPLFVEIFRIGEVGEPGRLFRGEELLQRPGFAALSLRFPDHAGADDK